MPPELIERARAVLAAVEIDLKALATAAAAAGNVRAREALDTLEAARANEDAARATLETLLDAQPIALDDDIDGRLESSIVTQDAHRALLGAFEAHATALSNVAAACAEHLVEWRRFQH